MLALLGLFVLLNSLALVALSVLVAKLVLLGQEALMDLVAACWKEGLLPVFNNYLSAVPSFIWVGITGRYHLPISVKTVLKKIYVVVPLSIKVLMKLLLTPSALFKLSYKFSLVTVNLVTLLADQGHSVPTS